MSFFGGQDMKLKSLVLGTAAGALAVTGAQAADLPIAPEPIDYVRVCDAFGPGFYFIPGTDTCLYVAGRVRVDYNYFDFDEDFVLAGGGNFGTSFRGTNAYRFRSRAYLYLDSRTNTEFGLLRTFTEVYWTFDTNGSSLLIGPQRDGGVGTTLNRAFIQFGGLTFGRTQSFYDFLDASFGSSQFFNANFSDTTLNVAAYTFAFGNGFSASISVEDTPARRFGPFPGSSLVAIQQQFVFVGNLFGLPGFGVFDIQDVVIADIDTTAFYAGTRAPDIVGNLRVDQAWGSAQVMGAAHFVQSALTDESEWGWAAGGGFVVNVPFGTNTSFGVQGGYTNGALKYVAGTPVGPGVADATVDFDESLNLVEAWSVSGGFRTAITPAVGFGVSAGYLNVDHDTTIDAFLFDSLFVGGDFLTVTTVDRSFTNLDVDAYLSYRPVQNLEFGLGAQWKRVGGLQGDVIDVFIEDQRPFQIVEDDPDSFDALSVFFRAQRTF
jgi:hypothetical protein